MICYAICVWVCVSGSQSIQFILISKSSFHSVLSITLTVSIKKKIIYFFFFWFNLILFIELLLIWYTEGTCIYETQSIEKIYLHHLTHRRILFFCWQYLSKINEITSHQHFHNKRINWIFMVIASEKTSTEKKHRIL